MQMLKRGAEAVIIREGSVIVKRRIKKGYRIEPLDKLLRERRTRHEANAINEARRAGVATPQVLEVKGDEIRMEFVPGERVKELVPKLSKQELVKLCEEIGRSVGKLHNYKLIHGDLTTSNFIYYKGKVYFIDFGLAFHSNKLEDMAYDLYVLKQAIQTTHPKEFEVMWKAILSSYATIASRGKEVLKRLKAIEQRGRYKRRSKAIKELGSSLE